MVLKKRCEHMNKNILLKWLNWFYTLEMSQVELYLNQARYSNDAYLASVLLSMAETETGHAKSIKEIIFKLDSRPMLIDKLLSQIIGFIPGRLSSFIGNYNLLWYNYILESVAVNDYRFFLNSLDLNSKIDRELAGILLNNMIEEDLHRLWFKGQRDSLKTTAGSPD